MEENNDLEKKQLEIDFLRRIAQAQTEKIEEIIGNIKSINLGHLTEHKFEEAVIHTNNALESLEDVKVLVGEK